MAVVSMSYLLEAGVHFGHQKRRWNPKMGEYIYTSRDDMDTKREDGILKWENIYIHLVMIYI